MHNCKTERERFTESLLHNNDGPTSQLPGCADCREEFTQVREALRITRCELESVVPSDKYFQQYQVRLRQRLEAAETSAVNSISTAEPPFAWLTRVLTTSIRLPVPVVALLLVVFAMSLFGVHKLAQAEPQAPQVSVVHLPIHVPVIQEKVITKVVYRKQKSHKARGSQDLSGSTYARSQKTPSLVGFKPLDEVKLTVIKGGSPDEK